MNPSIQLRTATMYVYVVDHLPYSSTAPPPSAFRARLPGTGPIDQRAGRRYIREVTTPNGQYAQDPYSGDVLVCYMLYSIPPHHVALMNLLHHTFVIGFHDTR
jgi:hypothetical protein